MILSGPTITLTIHHDSRHNVTIWSFAMPPVVSRAMCRNLAHNSFHGSTIGSISTFSNLTYW